MLSIFERYLLDNSIHSVAELPKQGWRHYVWKVEMSQKYPLVLIVDDDMLHRLIIADLLQDWGFRVNEAEDGLKALDFSRANQVDLILMDLQMPVMDGTTATGEIHKLSPSIPIVMMTGCVSDSARDEALQAGVFDYLHKPFDVVALKLIVARALEHSRSDEIHGIQGEVIQSAA